jgi:FAD/FMN-containing dehydrogenase
MQAKQAVPESGSAPCVGLVGLTLGGGIGSMQGLHGLAIDALESVRMVTAQGQSLTVSRTEHADLFWALRGAGANFGIITSATYTIHDATNRGQAVNADFLYPAAQNRSLWELLGSYDDYIPDELNILLSAGYNRETKQVSRRRKVMDAD